jgi:predicted amidohydrolase
MKVGLVQFAPVFGDIASNIAKVEHLSKGIAAELIVLPELFNTGYLFTSQEEAMGLAEAVPDGETTAALCRIARRENTHIVGGICERQGDMLFNSAVLISPEGYQGTYRKIHLFNEEKRWFQPGNGGFEVFDIGACRIGIMICFDWFFPEAARILALKGAQIICHSANLVLPFCQNGMLTRCLENRVFAITANRTGRETREGRDFMFTGKSQISGPKGDILFQAGHDTEEVGVVDIDVQAVMNKNLNHYNHLFADRRVDLYGDLLEPWDNLS